MPNTIRAGTAVIERAQRPEDGSARVLLSAGQGAQWVDVSKWSDYASGDVVYWERSEDGALAIAGRLGLLSANGLIALVAESMGVAKGEVRKHLGLKQGDAGVDVGALLGRLDGLLDRPEVERLATTMRDEIAFRMVVSAWARDGVSVEHCRKLHAAIGEGVMPLITLSSLSSIKSTQFTFADAAGVALQRGDSSDTQLIQAAIEKTLAENELSGSTFMGCQALANEVNKKLKAVGAALVSPGLHLSVLSAKSRITLRRINGALCVALKATAMVERSVARHIQRLVAGAPGDALSGALRSLSIELSDPFQRAAVAGAHAGVSVITGGPGTGKTTISALIARAADKVGLKTVYLAPTGAAAERSDESTGRGSSTVHAAIYTKEADRLAGADIVIVDEPSMLDIRTAALLLERIKSGCRLILIGDPEQLESVDAGNFLGDLIDSKAVPVFRLRNIYRSDEGSLICLNSEHFLDGEPRAVRFGDNYTMLEAANEADIADGIVARYLARLEDNPRAAIRVLAPMNKGECGVWALNQKIKQVVNPGDGKQAIKAGYGIIFHDGDKIVRTKNIRKLGLANGTTGVLRVDGGEMHLEARGRKIKITRKLLNDFSLAYAQTIHKAQGSEYDGVIMAVPPSASKMLNRKLSRTAMTRAKTSVDFVGSREVLLASALKPAPNRLTSLADELRGASAPVVNKKPEPRARCV